MAQRLVNEDDGRTVRVGQGIEVPLRCQSVKRKDGSRVSAVIGEDGDFLDNFEGVRTMHEAFQRGMGFSADRQCLGTRTGPGLTYEWITYNEVWERSKKFGSGLIENGLKPRQLMGIFAGNCPEYIIAQHAGNLFSIAAVTLYDTLGMEGILHILNEADLHTVLCGASKISLLFSLASQAKSLRQVIKFGDVTDEEASQAKSLDLKIVSMDQVMADGVKNPHEFELPTPDDLFIVCYTSGTTGTPKGVMLSHGNLAAQLGSMAYQLNDHTPLSNDTVHVSYLPMAHMMEQVVHGLIWVHGACMGFFRGDPKLLLDDLQELKPTVFPTVPRLLNRVFDRVMDGVNQSGFIKRSLFDMAFRWKKSYLEQGIVTQDTFFDWLVFSKVRARLGGRVTLIVTGAAPVSAEVLEFWRCVFGCPVVEGYGQSETVAGSNLVAAGDTRGGHVGPPIASGAIKLVSVPELNYLAENNEGEVCFKGPCIFKGYLNNEAKTKEAVDEDGWLHSGDIGRWNLDGTLSIFDRKKHIFKLAQGEYLAPEKIENVCLRASLVGQVFIYGDSLQTWCVAVVAPDEDVLPRWAKQNGLSSDLDQICEHKDAEKEVLSQIEAVCKDAGLRSFEIPKAVYLYPGQFSPENGLLTPTLKKKRPQIRSFFQEQLSMLYQRLGEKK